MRDLVRLPKAELHVHLEGSVRASTLMELADRYGRPLPSSLRDGRYSFVDLPDFLVQWLAVQDCLRGLEDLERIAFEFCQDEARQGVRYAETHVSLAEHAVVIGEWEGCLEAVHSGFDRGRQEYGVECAVIVDVVRGIDMALSERAMRTAASFAGKGVVASGWVAASCSRPSHTRRSSTKRATPDCTAWPTPERRALLRASAWRSMRSMPNASVTPSGFWRTRPSWLRFATVPSL
jgi:adenosine deaminase